MKIHLIGYPHTITNGDYNQCAYTQKNLKFMKMYPDVIHYGNEGSVGNLVQIFSEQEVNRYYGHLGMRYYAVEWRGKGWDDFNRRVIHALKKNIGKKDLIFMLGGTAQQVIADAYPQNITVEYGVGYEGVFSKYRIYESYAWQNFLVGRTNLPDFRYYDAVIPNYFDPADFPYSDQTDDYFLYLSRMTPRKGYSIAIEIANRTQTKLIIAGEGGDRPQSPYVTYIGYADTKKRAELMSHAKALLCPTTYLEPFGGVAVEAQMAGVPVITTDFGAFSETVQHGKTGYRCHTLEQFLWAAKNVGKLDKKYIQRYATKNYSIERVKGMYDEYIAMLGDLWGGGWYQDRPDRVQLDWLQKHYE